MSLVEILKLMTIASQLSGVPLPADGNPPFIFFEHNDEVQREFCQGSGNCIQVYAFTRGSISETHISDHLDGYSQQTIVVHELTHWLEYKAGVNAGNGMVARCLNEKLAQETEAKYMLQYEHKLDPDADLGVACRVILKLLKT